MPTDYSVLPMDKQFRLRRGSTTAINAYAGAVGEALVDLTKNTITLASGTAGTNYPLAREDRTITGGTGITLTGTGVVSNVATLASNFTLSVDATALVAANDLLTTDANGKIKSDFSLSYNNATGVFSVLAGDGTTTLATVTVPSHLSLLQSATLETATAAAPVNGATEGTFLHFVFNLSDGSTSNVYANVTDLIDVYTAGNGLALNNGEFSVVAGDGIEVTSTGVKVKILSTESVLNVDANGNLYTDLSAIQSAISSITIVSADTGNVITAGTDGGALLKVAAGNNLLTVNDDGELIVPNDMGVLSES